jgi:hypothetical protein
MHRKSFHFLCGALAMALSFFLLACGGDNGGDTTGPQPQTAAYSTISGTVTSPAGVSLTHVRNSLGESAVANGAFRLEAYATGRQLTVAQTASGNPALLGFLGPDQSIIDANSTADALLFWATGAFLAPHQHHPRLLDLLSQTPQRQTLAQALIATLEADPEAFAGQQPALAELLLDLAAQLQTSTAPKLIVNPLESRSGLTVNTVEGLNSVTLANRFRRPGHVFIDRVSTFDAEGNETASPAPLTDFELPAIQGLNTAVGTFVDIIWGRLAFEEKSTDPVELPTVEDAELTRYRLLVVGPGASVGDLALLSPAELEKQQKVLRRFLVRDLFLPLVLNVLIPQSNLDDYLKFAGGAGVVDDLIDILTGNVPGIWERSAAGDIRGALWSAYDALVTSDTFRNATLEVIVSHIQNTRGLDASDAAFKTAQQFAKAVAALDALLQVFDSSTVGASVAQSNMADIWTVDASAPTVRLTPPTTALAQTERIRLTATVPELSGSGVDLVYRWSNTATVGSMSDGQANHQDNFDSSRPRVTYTAGSDNDGSDKIKVEVFALAGPGQSQRQLVGQATAVVEVSRFAVRLNPIAVDAPGERFATAQVIGAPLGAVLRYHWTLSGISDGILQSEELEGSSLTTETARVALVAQARSNTAQVISTQEGTLEVRVELLGDDNEEIGTAKSAASVRQLGYITADTELLFQPQRNGRYSASYYWIRLFPDPGGDSVTFEWGADDPPARFGAIRATASSSGSRVFYGSSYWPPPFGMRYQLPEGQAAYINQYFSFSQIDPDDPESIAGVEREIERVEASLTRWPLTVVQ